MQRTGTAGNAQHVNRSEGSRAHVAGTRASALLSQAEGMRQGAGAEPMHGASAVQEMVQRASSPGHSLRGPIVIWVVRTALQQWGGTPHFALVGGYPGELLGAGGN